MIEVKIIAASGYGYPEATGCLLSTQMLLYLDARGSYVGVYLCKYSLNFTLKLFTLYACNTTEKIKG